MSVGRRQVTLSAGTLERHGIEWTHGDRFNYRLWLALRLLDRDAAKLYFRTTW